MAFAERFGAVANLIDECENAELVALLLSTCRNQWMAVNGMFVDLQEIVGSDHLPDLASRAFHHLQRGDAQGGAILFGEALKFRAALSQKSNCWERRESLLEQLEASIQSPDRSRLERNKLEDWLLRQRHGVSAVGRGHKAQYLRLDFSDGHCQQEMELIRRSAVKLTAALRIGHRVARALAGAQATADEARELEDTPTPLFELEVEIDSDRESVLEEDGDLHAAHEEKLLHAWDELRRAVHKHGAEIGFEVKGPLEGQLEVYGPDGVSFSLDIEPPELEEMNGEFPEAMDFLVTRAVDVTDKVRSEICEAFTPNVVARPMPAPFVIDFTSDDPESHEGRVRNFIIKTENGRQHTPNTAKLALLRCGMPASAFSTADKAQIVYDPDQREGARKAKQIALAAVAKAEAQGADFLAMPEIFLPRSAMGEVWKAADEARVGLIAGVEYPARKGGPINEVLIHVPGWTEPIFQRKQGPSVEELKHPNFETTFELHFLFRTALGNLGVVVCSDFLELDLLWAMSSFEHKLDVLVVCAHNYKPEIFQSLAIADAARLHALVAVVNSWTPREDDDELPSGKGTFVAQPNSACPLLEATEHPLDVEWENEIERPSLAVATLNIAEIRARELERPGFHGYISPPRFARL